MDWPFETNICRPVPRRICGFAEIVGKEGGVWQVGQIYVSDRLGWRHADHDEALDIAWTLHLLAGGDIGRAYRKSIKEPGYEHV